MHLPACLNQNSTPCLVLCCVVLPGPTFLPPGPSCFVVVVSQLLQLLQLGQLLLWVEGRTSQDDGTGVLGCLLPTYIIPLPTTTGL